MHFEEGFKATDTEAIEKAGLNKQYVPVSYVVSAVGWLLSILTFR